MCNDIKQSEIEIRQLQLADCKKISTAFTAQHWNKPISQYQEYYDEQQKGERVVFTAWLAGEFVGYVTVRFDSYYPYFHTNDIPEIMDLNVLQKFQHQGIATLLLDVAEALVFKTYSRVGISVGLTANYGVAQRMYVKRGYVPDGNGISCNEQTVPYLSQVFADDDLVLSMIKECPVA